MPDNQTPLPETCGCLPDLARMQDSLHRYSMEPCVNTAGCRYPEALRRIAELEWEEALSTQVLINTRLMAAESLERLGIERDEARKALANVLAEIKRHVSGCGACISNLDAKDDMASHYCGERILAALGVREE